MEKRRSPVFCGPTQLVLLLCVAYISARNIYQGSQVIRITARNHQDLEWLRTFQDNYEDKLDFWVEPSQLVSRPVDVMIPKSMMRELRQTLEDNNMQFRVMIPDVQGLINEQFVQMSGRVRSSALADFRYDIYHDYEEIQQWVIDMGAEHSDIVDEFLVTTSYEGREMRGLKISVSAGPQKKSIWFEGGIHAREWVSPATVMYITNQLITDYKNGVQRVLDILDHYDFYIVPSLNVDGYEYTWTTERLWRKTRSPQSADYGGCTGTDANRNWPYEWGGKGASPWGCTNTFRGPSPLSEVEMKGLTDYALAKAKEQEFRLFIDWHSYSQLYLAPWSYDMNAELPPESPDQLEAAAAAVSAIKSVHGMEYEYGPSAKLLYEASGNSKDWGFKGLGAKYSYVVELRDNGKYGFLLPEDQIIPCAEENYEAALALAEFIFTRDP